MISKSSGRKVLSGIGHGISLAEKGLAAYHTVRAGYAAGSALLSAAAPYMAATAAVLQIRSAYQRLVQLSKLPHWG